MKTIFGIIVTIAVTMTVGAMKKSFTTAQASVESKDLMAQNRATAKGDLKFLQSFEYSKETFVDCRQVPWLKKNVITSLNRKSKKLCNLTCAGLNVPVTIMQKNEVVVGLQCQRKSPKSGKKQLITAIAYVNAKDQAKYLVNIK